MGVPLQPQDQAPDSNVSSAVLHSLPSQASFILSSHAQLVNTGLLAVLMHVLPMATTVMMAMAATGAASAG